MTARLLNIVGEDAEKKAEVELDLNAALAETVALGASDLHIKPGCRPRVRIEGELNELNGYRPVGRDELHKIAKLVLTSEMKAAILEQEGSADLSYDAECGRFRCSAFRQRGGTSYIFRTIPEAPDFGDLDLPEVVLTWAGAPQGLVIVTGPTGSGKSTTSAALIRRINEGRSCHIVTVEDPIEFVHRHKKAVVNQREVGADTRTFARALRSALRQDPDVILVGELRDLESIAIALTAAETGHLVFATLHTRSAAGAIDRIVDVFPAEQQAQVRVQLSASLQGILAQALLPTADGESRRAAVEVLVADDAVRNLIRQAKLEQVHSYMHTGGKRGMHTLEQALARLVQDGDVKLADALANANDVEQLRRLVTRPASNGKAAPAHR
jgi:twitching motility protein PilT